MPSELATKLVGDGASSSTSPKLPSNVSGACAVCDLVMCLPRTSTVWRTHAKTHTWRMDGEFMCAMGCRLTYFDGGDQQAAHHRRFHAANSLARWCRPLVVAPPLSKAERRAEYEDFRASLKCDICRVRFSDSAMWQAHLLRHNPATGDWQCAKCEQKFFATADELEAHAQLGEHSDRRSCPLELEAPPTRQIDVAEVRFPPGET